MPHLQRLMVTALTLHRLVKKILLKVRILCGYDFELHVHDAVSQPFATQIVIVIKVYTLK